MIKQRIFRLSILILIALTPLAFVGCGEPELHSKWRTSPISIDGFDTEWSDLIVHHDKKSHVVIGMANDRDNLYIRLSTFDRTMQAQILRGGFTIWFDATGATEKEFGIQFPISGQMSRMKTQKRIDEKPSPEMIQAMLQESQHELQIVSAANEIGITMLASEADDFGISARVGITKGFLVYELKVPLISKDTTLPFEIFTNRSNPISIGFESASMEMAGRQNSKTESRGEKSGSRRGKGGRGGNSGEGRGKHLQRPQPFELWTKVYLADSPQQSSK